MTNSFDGCCPQPLVELETSAHIGLAGASRRPHIKHGGLSTWVQIVNGSNAWAIFEGPVDLGLMTEGAREEWAQHHTSQIIPLGPGNIV